MCGNDMLPKNFSRRICDKQLPTAFPHRLGTLGCGADFSKKALLHRGHTNCPICHNLSMCGCYRPSRRMQIVEEYFDRVSGEQNWSSRYNVAPTHFVAPILHNPRTVP